MKIARRSSKTISIESVIHSLRGASLKMIRILTDGGNRNYDQSRNRSDRKLHPRPQRPAGHSRGGFPEDFTFGLTRDETAEIARSRSQSVILKRGENIKYLPYVFTEHGAIMAANVLTSRHAVRMSVYVVRAFIRLRNTVTFQKEIMVKLDELERKFTAHDSDIRRLFATVRQLMVPSEPKKRKIGFLVEEKRLFTGGGSHRSFRDSLRFGTWKLPQSP